jgi:hypothetical protein
MGRFCDSGFGRPADLEATDREQARDRQQYQHDSLCEHERRLIALRRERVQFRHFQERLDDQYPNSPPSPATVPMRLSTTAAA